MITFRVMMEMDTSGRRETYTQSWGGWHGTDPLVRMRIVPIILLVQGMMCMRIPSYRFSLAMPNLIVNNSY